MRPCAESSRQCDPHQCQDGDAPCHQYASTAEKARTLAGTRLRPTVEGSRSISRLSFDRGRAVDCGRALDRGQASDRGAGRGGRADCGGCCSGVILSADAALILRQMVIDLGHASAEIEQGEAGKLRDFAVAAITCLLVGGERRDKITPLLEEYSEIERAGGVAALVRALVCVERSSRIALLFEQYPEVGSGGRMAPLIGATVGLLCLGELSALLELYPEIERAVGVAGLLREPVRVPRRRHATPSRGRTPSCPSR